jgi:hypothetical protein
MARVSIESNDPNGLKGLGQGVRPLDGLSTGQVIGDGTSFIGTRPNLMPKDRVVTIPMSAPFQVIGRLVIIDNRFFYLALSKARGTS